MLAMCSRMSTFGLMVRLKPVHLSGSMPSTEPYCSPFSCSSLSLVSHARRLWHKWGTPSLGIRDDQKGKDLPAHQGCRTRFAAPCELCLKQQLALPVGWSAHAEESGRAYFFCDSKGRSSWHRPAAYGPDRFWLVWWWEFQVASLSGYPVPSLPAVSPNVAEASNTSGSSFV